MQPEAKPLHAVVNDLKQEAKDFAQTRVQIFSAEMKEKLTAWKLGLPLLAAAALFAGMIFILMTFAVVSFIATLFEGQYAVTFALLIVAVGYGAIAGICGWFGYREIMAEGITPTRTLKVLKQDQIWIQNETRSA